VANGDVTTATAARIEAALESANLAALRDLLDRDVRCGAPGDPEPSCQNRDQALAWFQRGWDDGVRASVNEMVATADQVLIGLTIIGNAAATEAGGEARRWQVLTLRSGRVIDIRSYDDRVEAAAVLALPGP